MKPRAAGSIPQHMVIGVDLRLRERARADGRLDPSVSGSQLFPCEIVGTDASVPAPILNLRLNGRQCGRKAKIDIDLRAATDGHAIVYEDCPVVGSSRIEK